MGFNGENFVQVFFFEFSNLFYMPLHSVTRWRYVPRSRKNNDRLTFIMYYVYIKAFFWEPQRAEKIVII